MHIDLDFRPRNLFWPLAAETHLLSTIKGAERRSMAEAMLKSGAAIDLPEFVIQSALSDEDRAAFGRMHPRFMGGEYLPDHEEEELEIARINIDSTTSDVTSVYARRTPEGIRYRVVDEYNGDTLTGRTERLCAEALTLGELTDFFLAAWRLDEVLDMNDLDEDESLDFVHASSAFYPQFGALIGQKIHAWRHVEPPDDTDDEADSAEDLAS
jgi:hypothetical protein